MVSALSLKFLDPIILFGPPEKLHLSKKVHSTRSMLSQANLTSEQSVSWASNFATGQLQVPTARRHLASVERGERRDGACKLRMQATTCTLLLMPARSFPLKPLSTYTVPRVSASATRFTLRSAPSPSTLKTSKRPAAGSGSCSQQLSVPK